MTTIAIDGLSEEEFRRSIESGLRRGRADEAVAKLRELIEPFVGEGRILPPRFLTVEASDLSLKGWEGLGDNIRRFDRPGRLISAISIAFGWPGEDVPQPDAEGRVTPLVEVGYYNDDAFPFSRSGREDLLDGYSFHGCTWGDDCVGSDTALSLDGISDLHGALAALEARLLASEEPDPDEICAGSLGSCLLSALLYQAVSEKVAVAGLPRPLCVMAGSNGVYPYFDAPVTGMPVEVLKAAKAEDDDPSALDTGVPGPRYSSLLMTGIKRAPKRAVLVLEESEEEMAVRIANLRGLAHGHQDAVPPAPEVQPAAAAEPSGDEGITNAPNSPLMTKKPAGQGWDFRDMLSPRDGDSPPPNIEIDDWDDWDQADPEPAIEAEVELEAEFETESEADAPDWTVADPGPTEAEPDPTESLAPPEPAPAFELEPEPIPEPGFALEEDDLQQRLQTLLAQSLAASEQAAAETGEAEPVREESPQPEAEQPRQLALPPAELAGQVWPLGIDWLAGPEVDESIVAPEAECEAEPPVVEPEALPPAPRPGLWARIRMIFSALRHTPPPERSRRIGR